MFTSLVLQFMRTVSLVSIASLITIFTPFKVISISVTVVAEIKDIRIIGKALKLPEVYAILQFKVSSTHSNEACCCNIP